MSINLTTTQTKHKPIYTYTYRQKPLKLLKIKKGPIDKTFDRQLGFITSLCLYCLLRYGE